MSPAGSRAASIPSHSRSRPSSTSTAPTICSLATCAPHPLVPLSAAPLRARVGRVRAGRSARNGMGDAARRTSGCGGRARRTRRPRPRRGHRRSPLLAAVEPAIPGPRRGRRCGHQTGAERPLCHDVHWSRWLNLPSFAVPILRSVPRMLASGPSWKSTAKPRRSPLKGGGSIGRAAVSKTAGCRFESCPPCDSLVREHVGTPAEREVKSGTKSDRRAQRGRRRERQAGAC